MSLNYTTLQWARDILASAERLAAVYDPAKERKNRKALRIQAIAEAAKDLLSEFGVAR